MQNQYFKNDASTQEHTAQLDYTNPINSIHIGLGVGVALEFGKIIAGLEGQFGLVDVQKVGNPKNMNFSIVVGYKF